MASYVIRNTVSGAEIGTWEANSKEAALDLMAQDQGYDDYASQLETIESDGSDIEITEAT